MFVFAGAHSCEVEGALRAAVGGECLERPADRGDGCGVEPAKEGTREFARILSRVIDGTVAALFEIDVNASAIPQRRFAANKPASSN